VSPKLPTDGSAERSIVWNGLRRDVLFRGPPAVKATAHADALGSIAVFVGMMKWTAVVTAVALAATAAVYTVLVLGSRRGI
jgi:hypothetical protein